MRKLMWFTVGFGAACAFCAYFWMETYLDMAIFAGILGIAFGILTRKVRNFRIPAAILLGVAAGFAMFHIYNNVTLSDARELDGKAQRVTIIVRDYSWETNYGTAVDGSLELEDRRYPVRVYLDDQVAFSPGNRIKGEFEFEMTAGVGLEEVLYHRGQGTYLYAYQEGNIAVERCWSTPWRDLPAVWRENLKQTIDRCFPEDAAPFAKALLLGDRTDIDYETNTDFKVSGISHVIAVSGLHVSILFGLVYLFSGKRRFLTTIIGVPMVLLFAAVAGFTPSITRAAIMQCLMMVAMLCQREYDGPTALSFSALVMLIFDPLMICSVSFQLSFACMAGIFCFAEPLQNWLLDEKRLGKWDSGPVRGLAASLSVSLSSCVLTTPLCAVYFGTVSLIGPVTNLLTLWVITFIFYGVMLVCLLESSFLAGIVAWPIRYVLGCSSLLAEFPLAAVYTKSLYIIAWLVFVYLLLALYLSRKDKPTAVFGSLAVLSLCLALGLSWAEPWTDDYRMTVLDVGQGQAILLQSEGRTFLVDCGGDYEEDAADVTAETLLSQGISRLDGVILTHYDLDHAGGLPYLLTRIETDLILLPHSLDAHGMGEQLEKLAPGAVFRVMEDQELTFGQVNMTLFAPESYNSGNESSMCILFRAGKCDILITGDRGEAGERLLMKTHDLPDVDVLVAGHHGSKNSTTAALLDTVRPEYVFISVGEGNRYGHPAEETLERLYESGCIIYRTDENGTIIYRG